MGRSKAVDRSDLDRLQESLLKAFREESDKMGRAFREESDKTGRALTQMSNQLAANISEGTSVDDPKKFEIQMAGSQHRLVVNLRAKELDKGEQGRIYPTNKKNFVVKVLGEGKEAAANRETQVARKIMGGNDKCPHLPAMMTAKKVWINGDSRTVVGLPLLKKTTISEKVLKELLEALNELHSEVGVAHCDLHEDNVMRDDYLNGRTVLIDFGGAMPLQGFGVSESEPSHVPEYVYRGEHSATNPSLGCVATDTYAWGMMALSHFFEEDGIDLRDCMQTIRKNQGGLDETFQKLFDEERLYGNPSQKLCDEARTMMKRDVLIGSYSLDLNLTAAERSYSSDEKKYREYTKITHYIILPVFRETIPQAARWNGCITKALATIDAPTVEKVSALLP